MPSAAARTADGDRTMKAKRHQYWVRYAKRLDKERSRFPAWLMSNAKWRKVFRWLFEHRNLITGYRIKLVLEDVDRPWETRVLRPADLEGAHLADNDLYPVGYDEIEWVEIVSSQRNELRGGLVALAQLELRDSESGLRIYGYAGK